MGITLWLIPALFYDDRRVAELAVREIAQGEARRADEKDNEGEKELLFIKDDPIF
jgi:hypothetical protein